MKMEISDEIREKFRTAGKSWWLSLSPEAKKKKAEMNKKAAKLRWKKKIKSRKV